MREYLARQVRQRRVPAARLQMMRPRARLCPAPPPCTPAEERFPVYLVERSRTARIAVTRDLRSAGFEVRPFETVADFAGSTGELEPGCVVVDALQLEPPVCPGSSGSPNGISGYPTILTFETLSHEDAVMAVRLGAADLVHKPMSIRELSAALRRAAVRVREQRARFRGLQARAALDTLSAREREVMDGLVRGSSSKEIARALRLSPRTIEMYRSRLHRKLDVLSVAELVAIACRASSVQSAGSSSE